MNLIRAKSEEQGWDLDLGELARIWKGGCIIRASFLDRIKQVGGASVKQHLYCGSHPQVTLYEAEESQCEIKHGYNTFE